MPEYDRNLVAIRDQPSEGEGRRVRRTVLFHPQEGSLVEEQLAVYESRHAGVIPGQLVVQRMDTHFPRRYAPRRTFGLLSILICALSIGFLCGRDHSIHSADYVERTKHVMSTTPLIDGHNDMPYLIRIELKNHIYDKRFTFREGLLSPTDLKKLRIGGVGGQFWSAFIPCIDDVTDNFNTPTVNIYLPLAFAFCKDSSASKLTLLCRICFAILWNRSMFLNGSLRSMTR
jgi:hypothetical protein